MSFATSYIYKILLIYIFLPSKPNIDNFHEQKHILKTTKVNFFQLMWTKIYVLQTGIGPYLKVNEDQMHINLLVVRYVNSIILHLLLIYNIYESNDNLILMLRIKKVRNFAYKCMVFFGKTHFSDSNFCFTLQ